MAVTTVANIIKMTAAGDEINRAISVQALRWVGGATVGDQLLLTESSAGAISKELFQSFVAGPNFVEESGALCGARLQNGLRISVIDSGQVWIYLKET